MSRVGQFFLILALSLPTVASAGRVESGHKAFQRGHFEQAVHDWEAALAQFMSQGQTTQYIDTAVHLALAYQTLGLSQRAKRVLQSAQTRAEQINDPVRYANVLSHLGDINIATGNWKNAHNWENAQIDLDQAVKVAGEINSPLLLANIYNMQGNLWMVRGDLKNALKTVREKYYQRCIERTKPDQPVGIKRVQPVSGPLFAKDEQECIDRLKAQEKYPQCFEPGKPTRDKILTGYALQCLATAEAIEKYQLSLAKQSSDQVLTAKASLNLAKASLNLAAQVVTENVDYRNKAESAIKTAHEHVKALRVDSHDKAFALIEVAQLRQTLHTPPAVRKRKITANIVPNRDILRGPSRGIFAGPIESPPPPTQPDAPWTQSSSAQHSQFRQQNYDVLTQALKTAQTVQDDRAIAYAKGYIAQLYAGEKRYDEAIRLTRQVLFYAQRKRDYPELLYRWEWQLGRLFKKKELFDSAIKAYKRAVYHLEAIRSEFQRGGYRSVSQSFRETEGPLYFELADLLLQQAANATTEKQSLLKDAINHIELFKGVELRHYFQDECVTELQKKVADIDKDLPSHTAVFYPILLADRVELLLSLGKKGIQQFTVPDISYDLLFDEAEQFRTKLEAASNIESLQPHAQTIYQWFIKPIEKTLSAHNINTLVIVPDGILRTIPFAALHDGKQYLIEHYAVAVTPSMKLTDPARALQRDNIQILLNGLSKLPDKSSLPYEVNFSHLPQVTQELKDIHTLLGGNVLKDEDFVIANVETRLRNTPYTIVHFSTHGNFDSDPKKTFLLTYDDFLTMAHLRELVGISEFRDKPVELLTLSACQTAIGDDQAALGLAGVAVQAGARSALASLWSVNDVAMAELMKVFYQHLINPNLSKAQALQKAQQQFLSDPNRSHPYFWATFLLIGNWL